MRESEEYIEIGKERIAKKDICLYKYEEGEFVGHLLEAKGKTKKHRVIKVKMEKEEYKKLKIEIDKKKKYPKLYIILNPFSGTKKGEIIMKEIEEYLISMGIIYTIQKTEYPGHEKEIAEKTDFSQYDVIVSGGGDGTLYSIINGIISQHKKEIPIVSPLACGSGNGVAYSLYKDNEPITGMCHIICGEVTRIDGIILNHHKKKKKYYGILQFEFSYLSSIDFESECIRWLGAFRFILWTLWYCVTLMTTKAKIKTKKYEMTNDGECGALCSTCKNNKIKELDYTKDIADQIIQQHIDPDSSLSKNDGWEELPYSSYCIYFFNNFAYGMPGIEFAHGAHRNDGFIDSWILPGERATRWRFLGFWICAVLNLFVPNYISGFDYFRSTALSIRLQNDVVIGIDGEKLPPGNSFDLYVAPGLYRTMLCTN
ncbi:sphingosine kinase, putative [Entamoeba dispar SAW760]|uniref:Sphingosine kinase, putative n=1 Tax=Entamoeba dispar (strain ATCC PRA-260 / SAW760) TaxID=370354 RepID=B0ETD1_ENTDS|nr:sphingosine kinase, putative [Entamoeba dispar SAW760]EDR22215.1 sphingosine kinase, putative [Entamoeba dispar SAW760]|eukprot:EDR22215.1 sphingosine kinase, putative [Entamoeba dispar SAW760]